MKRPDTTEYYPSEAGKEWQAYAEWLEIEVSRLRKACSKTNDEICQILGKELGFPWFKDDQKNFPGATVLNGVCVGDNVAESMADIASKKIRDLEEELSLLMDNDGRVGGE